MVETNIKTSNIFTIAFWSFTFLYNIYLVYVHTRIEFAVQQIALSLITVNIDSELFTYSHCCCYHNLLLFQLMSPVENSFDETLLTFLSLQQQCWPVPSSASCVQQLGKEIEQETKQAFEEVNFHHEDINASILLSIP